MGYNYDMKKILIISLIILAIFGGLAFFRFFNTKNVLEINLFSKESGLAQGLSVSKLFSEPIGSMFTFSSTALKGEKEGQINILILGEGGANHPGGNLTDTILVGSISREFSKKATLFSIPRDLYVNPAPEQVRDGARIPDSNVWSKINAVKSNKGINSLKSTIEDLTGLPIHYWLSLNFDQFVEIIDILEGLSIYVEKDIYDPLFPGPNYSYEPFKLSQGWHYLDGQTALKYIRSRYSSGGDFDRTYRQQQVLEALRIKLNSPKSFLNIRLVSALLNTFTNDLKTNIGFSEMGRFYTLANQVWPSLIENKIIDISVSGLLTGQDHPTAGSILIPKAGIGNYGEIREWVKGILNTN